MKLRIHGNSLRLRLNQAEVAQFSKTGFFEDSVQFAPGASLCYTLEACGQLATAQALYQNGSIRIQIPRADADQWITTDRVSVAAEQPLSGGQPLSILIEKDFQCVHGEPEPHAYPNPLQDAASKS
jgi:hypothetical protein